MALWWCWYKCLSVPATSLNVTRVNICKCNAIQAFGCSHFRLTVFSAYVQHVTATTMVLLGIIPHYTIAVTITIATTTIIFIIPLPWQQQQQQRWREGSKGRRTPDWQEVGDTAFFFGNATFLIIHKRKKKYIYIANLSAAITGRRLLSNGPTFLPHPP